MSDHGITHQRPHSAAHCLLLLVDDESGYLELEELLLWWFKDNLDPGHIPTWDRADPEVALVEADESEDDG